MCSPGQIILDADIYRAIWNKILSRKISEDDEDLAHPMFNCDWAHKKFWKKIFAWWGIQFTLSESTNEAFRQLSQLWKNEKLKEVWSFMFISIAYHLWGEVEIERFLMLPRSLIIGQWN